MTTAFMLARLALAATLAVAGAAKLVDRAGTREAAQAFGVPRRLAGLSPWLVPVVELGIAVALLPGETAGGAAVAAVALLGVFTALVVVALARGRRVTCNCFGALTNGRIGAATLARNAVLLAVATFVALAPGAPGPGFAAWLGGLSAAGRVGFWLGLALTVVTTAGAWFARELLRQHGQLLVRLDALDAPPATPPPLAELAVGAPAPDFEIDAWAGGTISLGGLLGRGLPVALVFSDAGCAPCVDAVPVLAEAQRTWADRLTIAVISRGVSPRSEAAWIEHELDLVAITPNLDLSAGYGVPGAPGVVIVSPDGRVEHPAALGLTRITGLLAESAADALPQADHLARVHGGRHGISVQTA